VTILRYGPRFGEIPAPRPTPTDTNQSHQSTSGILTPMPLRTLGLIGGITYHSTIDYYRLINQAVAAEVGGHASAPLVMVSLNFQEVRDRQVAGAWEDAGRIIAGHARTLEQAGAEAIVICANLMHKVAPAVEAAVDIPLIHIADAVAAVARENGATSLGITGARWTMTDAFYSDRLAANGIATVRASDADVDLTDRIVFDELTYGIVTEQSKADLLGVVDRLSAAGAGGVVMGCTEIPLALSQDDSPVLLIDSLKAHAAAAARFILGG